jgi:beta-lactam-binding protein with PASTA domain
MIQSRGGYSYMFVIYPVNYELLLAVSILVSVVQLLFFFTHGHTYKNPNRIIKYREKHNQSHHKKNFFMGERKREKEKKRKRKKEESLVRPTKRGNTLGV